MSDREELAWAAGFFDGEGHIGSHVGKLRGRYTRRDLQISISQTDRWVLDRFRESVGGLGRVGGPLVRSYRNPNEHDVYQYQIARFEHVQAIIAMLWPWLSPIKKVQAAAALTATRARTTHKTVCNHGHPRTPANTYVTSTTGYRKCRPCHLGRERHLRLVKKTAAALLVAS